MNRSARLERNADKRVTGPSMVLRRSLDWFICCFSLLLCLSWGNSAIAQRAFKAGVVTRTITPTERRNWRGTTEHSFHITVWYPAAESAGESEQGIGSAEATLFVAGRAAPHAAFAPSLEPLPLILLSPAAGDSAAQIGWLGTALARAGFMAAAMDHPGTNAVGEATPEGVLLWWERATDLSEMLDGLLTDPELGPHINRGSIGAAGFSLGGYTVLELAGARTDIAALYDLCRTEPANPACVVPARADTPTVTKLLEAVRKTSGESLARSGESFRDPRVRAVFAIAPALGVALTPESLRSLRLPVGIVVGAADTATPAAANADTLRGGIRGARETVLPGVDHNTFLDICTPAGQRAYPVRCMDPPGVDREIVHAQVSTLATQFFAKSLHLR